MKICDIHTHILPGVDDGAQTMDDALQMLKNAVASDVEVLVVTPHCNVPGTAGNYRELSLRQRFFQLQEASRHLPVRLVSGAEVHVTPELPQLLREKKVSSIADGRYLLTEFPRDLPLACFRPALQEIIDCGYVPLIAHPERYDAVCQTPEGVEQWLDMGCHLQVTAGSVLGEYGKNVKKTATFLLKNDFVCCVASDAHGVTHRSNFLLELQSYLALYYSKQYAKILLWDNPMRIVHNESM